MEPELSAMAGMPPGGLCAGALTRWVLGLPGDQADGFWRRLVARARGGDPAWTVIAAGLALPGLRGARARRPRT